MLYESEHVRVEAADGVATLWLEFPGRPVNALSPARLLAIDRALAAAGANPFLDLLVIRSGRPAGFCGGADPDVLFGLSGDQDRAAYARTGQRVLDRLARSPLVSVAFLEGPCLGPGLELALACDHRLAVGGPDSWLGFPDAPDVPPCWGGSARLRRLVGDGKSYPLLGRGALVTAREARTLGLVDDAFSQRRAKVELRLFLDRLLARPFKRAAKQAGLGTDLARERAAFRAAGPWPDAGGEPVGPDRPLPRRVGLVGSSPETARLAVELALRGAQVFVSRDAHLESALLEATRRGRVTPLEADQARGRIARGQPCDRADLVVVAGPTDSLASLEADLSPRTILVVPGRSFEFALRPRRVVGLDLDAGTLTAGPGTADDVVQTLRSWFGQLGWSLGVARVTGRPLLRAAA